MKTNVLILVCVSLIYAISSACADPNDQQQAANEQGNLKEFQLFRILLAENEITVTEIDFSFLNTIADQINVDQDSNSQLGNPDRFVGYSSLSNLIKGFFVGQKTSMPFDESKKKLLHSNILMSFLLEEHAVRLHRVSENMYALEVSVSGKDGPENPEGWEVRKFALPHIDDSDMHLLITAAKIAMKSDLNGGVHP